MTKNPLPRTGTETQRRLLIGPRPSILIPVSGGEMSWYVPRIRIIRLWWEWNLVQPLLSKMDLDAEFQNSTAISQKLNSSFFWRLVTGPRSYSSVFFQTFLGFQGRGGIHKCTQISGGKLQTNLKELVLCNKIGTVQPLVVEGHATFQHSWALSHLKEMPRLSKKYCIAVFFVEKIMSTGPLT